MLRFLESRPSLTGGGLTRRGELGFHLVQQAEASSLAVDLRCEVVWYLRRTPTCSLPPRRQRQHVELHQRVRVQSIVSATPASLKRFRLPRIFWRPDDLRLTLAASGTLTRKIMSSRAASDSRPNVEAAAFQRVVYLAVRFEVMTTDVGGPGRLGSCERGECHL